jgi:hypothetical protein
MRVRSLIAVGIFTASYAAAAALPARDVGMTPRDATLQRPAPQRLATPAARRFLSIRSLGAEVDARVLANLLVDMIPHNDGAVVSVSAGEVNRCRDSICHVPLTVKVAEASGPVSLTFAVANAKGVLSDLQHVECGTGSCTVDLILEKGRNTLSLGALDGLAQTSGFKLLTINAVRLPMAGKPKTEWF